MNRSEAGKLGAEASRSISFKLKDDRIKIYEKQPAVCKQCSLSLSYDKRHGTFCNRSCAAKNNNIGIKRNFSKFRVCTFCSIEYSGYKTRSGKCKKCVLKEKEKHLNRTFDELKIWEKKKFLMKERNGQCEICKICNWMGKELTIELDHVDGNSDNDIYENLRLLCPNCHSQTPTYRGKNRQTGKKRKTRRMKNTIKWALKALEDATI